MLKIPNFANQYIHLGQRGGVSPRGGRQKIQKSCRRHSCIAPKTMKKGKASHKNLSTKDSRRKSRENRWENNEQLRSVSMQFLRAAKYASLWMAQTVTLDLTEEGKTQHVPNQEAKERRAMDNLNCLAAFHCTPEVLNGICRLFFHSFSP